MGRTDLQTMAEHWERFARENPMHFIATARHQWTAEEFYASAAPLVATVLDWIGPNVPRRRVLEIGCGLGRVTSQFAHHFERADGVDISPAMIAQAIAASPSANLHFSVVDGDRLNGFNSETIDLVYCGLVFQHIPDATVIQSYLQEIARVLTFDGRAVLQFDTRAERFWLRTYKALPDALLPPRHRRFIRRYRRNAQTIRTWMANAGLHIVDEHDAGQAEHFFIVRRSLTGSP